MTYVYVIVALIFILGAKKKTAAPSSIAPPNPYATTIASLSGALVNVVGGSLVDDGVPTSSPAYDPQTTAAQISATAAQEANDGLSATYYDPNIVEGT